MTCNSPIGSSSCSTNYGAGVGQAFNRLSELLQDRRLLDLLDNSRNNGSIVEGGWVLALRVLDGRSFAEIAAELGYGKEGSARVLFHRAMREFQQLGFAW